MEIRRICCIGTGIMGPGIALAFALGGYPVHLYGRSHDSVRRGLSAVEEALDKFRQQNLISKSDIPAIMERIRGVTTLKEAAANADFIVEAIVEDLAAKQKIFADLEKLCSPQTVFASSTSGLLPSEIAQKLEHKERFIVTHFWNPPHLIPLVEIVPGTCTSQITVDLTADLMHKINKKPVVMNKEVLGFIGNRLQFAMLREALYLLDSGVASKEAIDTTIKYTLGRRLSTTGPLESADLGGLDTIYNVASYLFADLCNEKQVSPTLSQLVDEGKLGAKTGSGFYDWTPHSLVNIKKIREENLFEWLEKDNKKI